MGVFILFLWALFGFFFGFYVGFYFLGFYVDSVRVLCCFLWVLCGFYFGSICVVFVFSCGSEMGSSWVLCGLVFFCFF